MGVIWSFLVVVEGGRVGGGEGGKDSAGFSLKCNSPKISVKDDESCSMGFVGLIWFQERDSKSVGFSGSGFLKICWRLPQAAMC